VTYTSTMETIIRFIADGLVIVVIILSVATVLYRWRKGGRYDVYVRIAMAGITAYVVSKYMGSAWQPEQLRPFERIGANPGAAYLNNPGSPSDHALIAFFLAGAVWYATRHRALTITVVCLALTMCVGRVLALVHTPVDIVGSLVAATVGAIWYYDRGYAKKSSGIYMAKPAKK